MSILRTATGREYPCDFMGTANGGFVLYVRIKIDTYEEVLLVFQNPEETNTMSWIGEDGEIGRVETGFTVFTGFDNMGGPCPVRIRMEKPVE